MSDATSQSGHHNDHDDGPHEGPIKTPKQLILAVFYAFVIPILVIALLTVYVTSDHRPAAGCRQLEETASVEHAGLFVRMEHGCLTALRGAAFQWTARHSGLK